MMSGSSTTSSTPPLTSPLSAGESGESRTVEDNERLSAGRQAGVGIGDEGYYRIERSPGPAYHRGDAQNMDEYPELSRQMSSPDVASSRAGPTPIDLTRPMPSHPARHRKRRLTSLGEHPRLQRTRSGEGPTRESHPGAAFPHRSVSMIVPSLRAGSSMASGLSYATAIDITSSPPGPDEEDPLLSDDQGSHQHQPAEGTQYAPRQTDTLLREAGYSAVSSAFSRRASALSTMANRDRSDRFRQSQALSTEQWPETSVRQVGPVNSLSPSRMASQQREGSTSHRYNENVEAETELPRWQPDSEVTECPICGTVFKLWYRKHHCRKCGRVVCASCSPHRITIPRQYIVRPPDSSSHPTSSPIPLPRQVIDLTVEDLVSSSLINPALGGGEEVRLCNPCVPDPNPHPLNYTSVRPHGHRATQSLSSTMLPPTSARRPSTMRLVSQKTIFI